MMRPEEQQEEVARASNQNQNQLKKAALARSMVITAHILNEIADETASRMDTTQSAELPPSNGITSISRRKIVALILVGMSEFLSTLARTIVTTITPFQVQVNDNNVIESVFSQLAVQSVIGQVQRLIQGTRPSLSLNDPTQLQRTIGQLLYTIVQLLEEAENRLQEFMSETEENSNTSERILRSQLAQFFTNLASSSIHELPNFLSFLRSLTLPTIEAAYLRPITPDKIRNKINQTRTLIGETKKDIDTLLNNEALQTQNATATVTRHINLTSRMLREIKTEVFDKMKTIIDHLVDASNTANSINLRQYSAEIRGALVPYLGRLLTFSEENGRIEELPPLFKELYSSFVRTPESRENRENIEQTQTINMNAVQFAEIMTEIIIEIAELSFRIINFLHPVFNDLRETLDKTTRALTKEARSFRRTSNHLNQQNSEQDSEDSVEESEEETPNHSTQIQTGTALALPNQQNLHTQTGSLLSPQPETNNSNNNRSGLFTNLSCSIQ